MEDKLTLRFISDPGHGWLRVPIEMLKPEMGISGFSYVDAEWAYLEEDCDAGRFFQVYDQEKFNIEYRNTNHNSAIRDLPRMGDWVFTSFQFVNLEVK